MSTTEIGVAAGAGALVLAVLVATRLWRRNVLRRLHGVVLRLDATQHEPARRSRLERTLTALERASQAGMARVDDANVRVQRVEVALDHVAIAVVVYDDDGILVHRNRHAALLLADEATGVGTLLDDLARAAIAGERQQHEVTIETAETTRSLSVTVEPMDDGWRGIGAVAVIEDVSEQRRSDAARRDFVADVGRELRAPIGALGALAETIAEDGDAAVNRRLAARLRHEAGRVGRAIDELIDLTGMEANDPPHREALAVHTLVAQALARVRSLADERAVRLEVAEIPRRLTLPCDRRQLVGAVANLLDNAVRHSHRGGAVELEVVTTPTTLDLVVRDHGPGLALAEQARVFERFYRLGREGSGAGLGLTIVRRVAEAHGGDVLVESRPGHGAAFTLRLPVRVGAAPAPADGDADTGGSAPDDAISRAG